METVTGTSLPNRLHRGKVRDTYDLGGGLLLMVATDRISAFDVVLPTGIPEKGVILSSLSAFWFRRTASVMPNHLVGLATEPQHLRGIHLPPMPPGVARRAMVVRRAQRVEVECVARGYLAGSAWAEYRERGSVQGHPMPPGLREGERLARPIFTPTTKAQEGHDQPLTRAELHSMVGEPMAAALEERTLELYLAGAEYAAGRGIIIADTKLEFGLLDGRLILIDELLTPDSSRFWDAAGYAPGGSQPNFDKQFVRDWLNASGWDHEPPAPALPPDVVERTRERYLEAYTRLTGGPLP